MMITQVRTASALVALIFYLCLSNDQLLVSATNITTGLQIGFANPLTECQFVAVGQGLKNETVQSCPSGTRGLRTKQEERKLLTFCDYRCCNKCPGWPKLQCMYKTRTYNCYGCDWWSQCRRRLVDQEKEEENPSQEEDGLSGGMERELRGGKKTRTDTPTDAPTDAPTPATADASAPATHEATTTPAGCEGLATALTTMLNAAQSSFSSDLAAIESILSAQIACTETFEYEYEGNGIEYENEQEEGEQESELELENDDD